MMQIDGFIISAIVLIWMLGTTFAMSWAARKDHEAREAVQCAE